ncbi:YhcN/YlaJ family sporulation lipoprotein [Paenibacillus thiaminolyticus]|uniref:YhcN/YlaJ family sporulation lipoprotein n=1 Tax=Paenibacillus thiaminolyticus TaxID=49283 RepID=UPI00232F154C|nr:YhcN/YlaJ family sporulation lipoprotein [Paenibacillus thiaminolyticus]WCF11124.1 YhcN/YlaJ family sporulation lipoprotein [Paenibacillus thiaminolyticus]
MHRLLVAIVIVGMLAGCGNANRQATPRSSAGGQAQPIQDGKHNIQDAGAVSQHLADLAGKVHGVKAANCVVFGNTAIVGIDVDGATERSRVGTIKYSVAEALSKDKYGANALVTADMDINARLREMAADIRQGRPISGFANELADIVGRIVPQVPSHVKQIRENAPEPAPKDGTRSQKGR